MVNPTPVLITPLFLTVLHVFFIFYILRFDTFKNLSGWRKTALSGGQQIPEDSKELSPEHDSKMQTNKSRALSPLSGLSSQEAICLSLSLSNIPGPSARQLGTTPVVQSPLALLKLASP